ncbi:hypothetical protein OsJ_31101 [Oryza sativa Japonica Group]|uniref:Uncharacterized protein n=1 Tax=Oryza sativa subsp. japonica TaxID=39947 RepID=A3C3M5_ORYSJ|nr:hypothetical protein OsJ_31101 [Oryza sativa Japonica Group]
MAATSPSQADEEDVGPTWQRQEAKHRQSQLRGNLNVEEAHSEFQRVQALLEKGLKVPVPKVPYVPDFHPTPIGRHQ